MIMEKIKVHGLGSEMQGVGRLKDGRAVFVPGVLPGETAEVGITKDANRFCEARLVRIIEASEHRKAPDCAHYGLCGGCSARHMDYEYTLEMKRQRVYDALKRIGGVDDPKVYATIGSDDRDRCRNKAEYAVYKNTTTITNRASWYVPPTDVLIQTGQLNWPVPILVCAGLLLLVIGCTLLRRGKKHA